MVHRRILIKDLRCGVRKTVNGKKEQVWQVHGAQAYLPTGSDSKPEKKLVGEKMLEVKLDGVRVVTSNPDGKVDMLNQ